jgi:DNA-directed RNA polymerase subunit E'/Rpb7
MAQISLYYQTQLETKVSLLPEHINGDIDYHIETSLKDKIDGKSIENGIVIRIIKLISYDYGMIDKTNLMGTTNYKVKYECLLCSPVKDLEMIGVVDNIVPGYIICRNGPIIAAVQFTSIDTHSFKVMENKIYHIPTNKEIIKGDYLKVSIININNNPGERKIVAVCKLLNTGSKNDIKKFKEEQSLVENIGVDENVEFI